MSAKLHALCKHYYNLYNYEIINNRILTILFIRIIMIIALVSQLNCIHELKTARNRSDNASISLYGYNVSIVVSNFASKNKHIFNHDKHDGGNQKK